MKKLILDNQTDLPMIEFILMVEAVIVNGKVSNDGKQHAYATTFEKEGEEYVIYSELNKKSERLILQKSNPEGNKYDNWERNDW